MIHLILSPDTDNVALDKQAVRELAERLVAEVAGIANGVYDVTVPTTIVGLLDSVKSQAQAKELLRQLSVVAGRISERIVA